MKKLFFVIAAMMYLISCETTYNSRYGSNSYTLNPDLSHIKYSGGNGSSYADAIVIENAKNSNEGIASEYAYLNNIYGARNINWNFLRQELDNNNGKKYDILTILRIQVQDTISVCFDITNFYGK